MTLWLLNPGRAIRASPSRISRLQSDIMTAVAKWKGFGHSMAAASPNTFVRDSRHLFFSLIKLQMSCT